MMSEGFAFSEITLEDLQEQHREIAECIGLPGFLKLVKMFGGNGLYIPQMKEVVRLHVYRLIQKEFDGTNIRSLSKKYGVSESTVYNVVREQIRSGAHRHPTIPGQMSIMDFVGSGELQNKL